MLALQNCSVILTAAPSLAKAFASTTTFDFTEDASPTGLIKSDWPVEDTPYDRIFVPENVRVQGGFLELIVPGGQTGDPILCAEVATEFRVQSASVRTYAILTDEPGVVNGMFHYHNKSQETDIEWLNDPESLQNIEFNENASGLCCRAPTDAISAVHEHRLDWTAKATRFYLDGVLQQTQTQFVPSAPGEWYWNIWANGDPNFTVGPPSNDTVFKIQKIVMYHDPEE